MPSDNFSISTRNIEIAWTFSHSERATRVYYLAPLDWDLGEPLNTRGREFRAQSLCAIDTQNPGRPRGPIP